MRDIDSIKADADGQGFQFPGVFEITVMGNASAELPVHVPEILTGLGLQVLHETVKHRQSREANFISVTVSFHCDTREQYDAAHAALRADPDIRYTL
jgi:putative lipoic acid-binding regulatory protein